MSPTEVVGAVTDLLKAAGMPLDLERRQLLQQSLVLQRQAKEAQEELAKQAQVSFADLHRRQFCLFQRYRNPSGGARVLLAAAPCCSNADKWLESYLLCRYHDNKQTEHRYFCWREECMTY